ncbi:hypothetical protein [Chryseobacterium sp.]|uniref:hypothetical protein n=1 Tax=Chryseobacterium sp. TaxID=1871047 RepID=UPI0011CB1E17|nr:hypothetical protein [Chryseobacterium sp.]TXF75100.1 hypothetical protein FUA25_12590 [Chryseobacterium sp.]
MKKIFFYITVLSLPFMNSCKNDSTDSEAEQVSIETQNTYDDQAIQKYLNENYLDTQGNITAFSSTDAADDNYPKLKDLNQVTLPSGVVYIVRSGVQPNPGKTIGSTDILRLMHKTVSYMATNTENTISFTSPFSIRNTMASTGVPDVDPFFYYAKSSLRAADKPHEYYEIEGFREALQHFKSYDLDDSASYNLQGVIIVPSRAAYARNSNFFDSSTYKFIDRSFVFNFQVYKTSDRPAGEL